VLLTEKRLVVSFWIFFKYLGNHIELEKNRNHFFLMRCGCRDIWILSATFLLIQEYLS